jgi:hypothetical protein
MRVVDGKITEITHVVRIAQVDPTDQRRTAGVTIEIFSPGALIGKRCLGVPLADFRAPR